jgi:hypothetical protein
VPAVLQVAAAGLQPHSAGAAVITCQMTSGVSCGGVATRADAHTHTAQRQATKRSHAPAPVGAHHARRQPAPRMLAPSGPSAQPLHPSPTSSAHHRSTPLDTGLSHTPHLLTQVMLCVTAFVTLDAQVAKRATFKRLRVISRIQAYKPLTACFSWCTGCVGAAALNSSLCCTHSQRHDAHTHSAAPQPPTAAACSGDTCHEQHPQ